jgi:hypothetical protein
VHFGLGARSAPAQLEIRWCGAAAAQRLTLEPGRYHRIVMP